MSLDLGIYNFPHLYNIPGFLFAGCFLDLDLCFLFLSIVLRRSSFSSVSYVTTSFGVPLTSSGFMLSFTQVSARTLFLFFPFVMLSIFLLNFF